MHWNHRVVKAEDLEGRPYFMLREVYYDEEGNTDVHGEPFMHSETLAGLEEIVVRLSEALTKPVLDHTNFPEENNL